MKPAVESVVPFARDAAVNPNNEIIRKGSSHWGEGERTATDCFNLGLCGYGCPVGAKQSTLVVFFEKMREEVDVYTRCYAQRVVIKEGRAAGVDAFITGPAARLPHRLTVRAKAVVLCCGAIDTAVLLLRSGVEQPRLGKSLFFHPTTAVGGIFDEPIEMWEGVPLWRLCRCPPSGRGIGRSWRTTGSWDRSSSQCETSIRVGRCI